MTVVDHLLVNTLAFMIGVFLVTLYEGGPISARNALLIAVGIAISHLFRRSRR